MSQIKKLKKDEIIKLYEDLDKINSSIIKQLTELQTKNSELERCCSGLNTILEHQTLKVKNQQIFIDQIKGALASSVSSIFNNTLFKDELNKILDDKFKTEIGPQIKSAIVDWLKNTRFLATID